MSRRRLQAVLAVSAVTAALSLAAQSGASSPPFSPPCPRLTYSPDGNVSPLFCKIANPAALAFYGKLVPGVVNIGSNATPVQVDRAFQAAARAHITPPEACQAYKLFAYRWGWHFAGGPAAVLPQSLAFACS